MATALGQRITLDEFISRSDTGVPEELVKGEIVSMTPPKPRHGQVCSRADRILGLHVDGSNLGHLLSNDAGVVISRDPDTLRGADLAYYSFDRVPPGPLPNTYLEVAPDLVVEVRSHDQRWSSLLEKVGEYLSVGVRAAVVLDPGTASIHLFRPESAPEQFRGDEELTIVDIFGEQFRVRAAAFFE